MVEYREMVILIAEDDDGHAVLIQEGLRASGVCNSIHRFIDGEDIWQFLSGVNGASPDPHNAYLLLLDIKMPRMDGVEVLKRMKSSEDLKDIPVIMLTTTDDPREIEHCYHLGCNFYITKPVDFIQFAETLQRLGLFVQIVTL